MTEDRRNLLLCVSEQMYTRRCRCGRCDCVSADPYEIAQRIFVHWSIQYRELAAIAKDRAEFYRRFERKAARSRNPLIRERRAEHATNAAKEERRARGWARASLRYERLGRGLPPFVAAEGERSDAPPATMEGTA